jgi:hypothetical protein
VTDPAPTDPTIEADTAVAELIGSEESAVRQALDGRYALLGGGGSASNLLIVAGAMTPRFGSPTLTSAGAVPFPRWLLDGASTLESLMMIAQVPEGWATYDVVIVGSNDTNATGNVRLGTTVDLIAPTGTLLGVSQAAPVKIAAAEGLGVRQETVIATGLSRSVSSRGFIRVSIIRDPRIAEDTLAGDYGILWLELRRKS